MSLEAGSSQQSLLRNSAVNFAGQLIPLFVAFATIPYLIRGLGNDAFGVLSIAWMFIGYFTVFDLGLSRATTKFAAEYLNPQKMHELPQLIYTTIAAQGVLGVVGGGFTAALVPTLVTRVFKMPATLTGEASACLFILAASVPILLCGNALRGILEAAQRFDLVNVVKVPASVLMYLLAAAAVPMHARVHLIVLVSVTVRVVATVAYLVLCAAILPCLRTWSRPSLVHARRLVSFGGWLMVSTVAGQVFGYLERFMVAALLSVGMLTYYAAPFELISKVIIFPASIAPVLFPFMSRQGESNSSVVSDVSSRTIKYLLFVITPVIAIFVFFAKDILRLWLGADFAAESTIVLQLLALTFFLNAFAHVPLTSVQALGRPQWKAGLDVAALPAFALYAYFFMSHAGISGAAAAKLLSSIIDCGFLFYFAYRLKAFSPASLVKTGTLRAVTLSGCLAGAMFLLSVLQMPISASAVLLGITLAAYVAAFWMFAVDESDREAIKRAMLLVYARRSAVATAQ